LIDVEMLDGRPTGSGNHNRSDIMRQSTRIIESRSVRAAETNRIAEYRSGDRALSMLVADDDASVVELLANYGTRMGFDVDTASDGIQAFVKIRRTKPNILVIDINMPEIDGLSVCDHLQDADQAPANVIVITGSKHPHTLERCERAGTYCARKGPNFWNDLEAALAEIDPRVVLLPRGRESSAVPDETG
jgi:CheY-like chemotaxis protein